MARNRSLTFKRDQDLIAYFKELKAKHPKWRYEEWLKDTGEKFYLETETVRQIITGVVRKPKVDDRQIKMFDE